MTLGFSLTETQPIFKEIIMFFLILNMKYMAYIKNFWQLKTQIDLEFIN